jgi:hypothetical protein
MTDEETPMMLKTEFEAIKPAEGTKTLVVNSAADDDIDDLAMAIKSKSKKKKKR